MKYSADLVDGKSGIIGFNHSVRNLMSIIGIEFECSAYKVFINDEALKL